MEVLMILGVFVFFLIEKDIVDFWGKIGNWFVFI